MKKSKKKKKKKTIIHGPPSHQTIITVKISLTESNSNPIWGGRVREGDEREREGEGEGEGEGEKGKKGGGTSS